jgi:hypothetical protein
MAPTKEATYQVYLLRAWRERPASPGHPAVWRFSLEDVRTRQRRGFGSLEGLVAFLRAEVIGETGAGCTEAE